MTGTPQEARFDPAEPLDPDASPDEPTDTTGAEPQQDAAAQAGETPPAGSAGDGGGDARSEDDLLDEMKGTITELTADLQRLQAEYLNYKRRVDRDRDTVLQNAKVSVLNALLPVLDDIDRAREHEELAGGFKAVAEGLERVVGGAGLEKFGAPGDEFDPRLHEALSHSYADPDDGVTTTTCQYVVQAGYRTGDRVVRPAKVTVVDPAPGGATDGDEVSTSSTDASSADSGEGERAG